MMRGIFLLAHIIVLKINLFNELVRGVALNVTYKLAYITETAKHYILLACPYIILWKDSRMFLCLINT
jgi:hypothetical protein